MIKRVLVSGAVFVGAALLACGGDSGTDLKQKPQIITDRDSIVDTFFVGQGRGETLLVQNKGVEDLVVSGLQLSASDPGLVTPVTLPDGGVTAPFLLLSSGVLDLNGQVNNTIKSNQTGLVAMRFTRPAPGQYQAADGGIYQATLTITSNAENFPSKNVPLENHPGVLPDGGAGP
jgi:hypothetical protein